MTLTEPLISRIKAEIWSGQYGSMIAQRHGLSESFISNIGSGARWPLVQWPDGTTGAMGVARRKEIAVARRTARTAALRAMNTAVVREMKR